MLQGIANRLLRAGISWRHKHPYAKFWSKGITLQIFVTTETLIFRHEWHIYCGWEQHAPGYNSFLIKRKNWTLFVPSTARDYQKFFLQVNQRPKKLDSSPDVAKFCRFIWPSLLSSFSRFI
jgi:hypothetical protein